MTAPSTPPARAAKTRTLPDDEAAVGRRYATPEAGQRIGRYEIKQRLGAGGMGTVYLANDPQLQREVAVKLIRSERAGSEQSRARFVREARAMAKIAHPNVVEVYDSGVSEGRPYVVMELVRGTTLGGWLAESTRSVDEILRQLVAAGQGLVAAHDAGLIHRDFKPANVLIGGDGRVRVSDFGLARALQESLPEPSENFESTQPEDVTEGSLTRTGAVLGSPVYMAPEQQQGDPQCTVDARADQFAFAVTAVEALLGTRPFEAASSMGLLTAKLEGPPSIPGDNPWLRRHAADLRRALHPDPARRFPSMRALLKALRSGGLGRPALLAGAAIGVGLVGLALVPEPDERCQVGFERMEALWDQAQRDAVRAALIASGRDHAKATAVRVIEQLDARTEAWAKTYAEACQSPDDGLDARMACLESQRGRMSDGIAKLQAGDAATTDRAIAIASSGSMPARCLQREKDELDDIEPDKRELAEEIRAEVRHAKRREHLGYGEEADSLTERALERARGLGYAPLLAFALTTRGSALESVGNYDESAKFLYEAVEVAESVDAWKMTAAAQVEAVFLEGYRRGDSKAAIRLARLAEAALARAGGDPQLEASLLNNLGATYHAMGDVDGACSSMAAALQIREANPRAYSSPIAQEIAVVSARENVGACMIMAGNYAEALPYLEAALEASRSVFGENNPELAGLHQALSSALESTGRYTEALEHIDHCIALWEKSLPPGDDRLAGARADRGYALSSSGRLAEAAEEMQRAADLMEAARGREDPRPWTYRANAAEALVELGQLDRAEELATTALRRVLPLVEPGDISRGVVQKAAGRVAMAKGDPTTALQHYQGALKDSELLRGDDHLTNVPLHIDVAKAQTALDNPAGAVASLERAVALAAVEPQFEPIHSGEAYFELAKALADSDPERARQLAERAREIYGLHAEMPDRVEEVRAWLAMQR